MDTFNSPGENASMQDGDNTKIAEDKLAQTVGTTLALWLRLKRFYQIASSGVSAGADQQIVTETITMRNLVETGELARYLYDPNDAEYFLRVVDSAEMRLKTIETAQGIIDGACIVFAHGILESCVYDYLTVTAIARPQQWEFYIKKKSVEFGTLKNTPFEQIRKDKVEKLLKSDVKRESLIDKLDRLHQIVPPTPESQRMRVSYDRRKLVEFDEARHKIVHGNDWSSYSFDFDEEWNYWSGLNFYFACLVCVGAGLKLHTAKVGRYWRDG